MTSRIIGGNLFMALGAVYASFWSGGRAIAGVDLFSLALGVALGLVIGAIIARRIANKGVSDD
jgi:hypothetical protein